MNTGTHTQAAEAAHGLPPRWIPIAGLLYALSCPVSAKYFKPFHRIFHGWVWHGSLPRVLGINYIAAGDVLLRVLLLTAFVFALAVRNTRSRQRWNAVATGMYWPLLIPTTIFIAGSGYGMIFAWLAFPIHVGIAIAACIVMNRRMAWAGRWIWLGVVAGFSLWLLSSWT